MYLQAPGVCEVAHANRQRRRRSLHGAAAVVGVVAAVAAHVLVLRTLLLAASLLRFLHREQTMRVCLQATSQAFSVTACLLPPARGPRNIHQPRPAHLSRDILVQQAVHIFIAGFLRMPLNAIVCRLLLVGPDFRVVHQ